ncbi:hypothetical protein ABZY05_50755 [Streptomyces canus]|uniref:hypothetical protein n=1 Tax=Streptomyces canus TaxID=58343 RepID=UPI0033A0C8AD
MPARSLEADVRVPVRNLLGERGRGYGQFLRILDEGRWVLRRGRRVREFALPRP